MNTDTHHIYHLCASAAAGLWRRQRPSEAYQQRVTAILLGTAATESHLRHRRQHGFAWHHDGGAWGLWQTEWGAVSDSLRMLRKGTVLSWRCGAWLMRDADANMRPFFEMRPEQVMPIIAGWDRLAVMFCRLHYLRVNQPIPETICEQAAYWKQYYNTKYGAGTVDKYLADWQQHAAPVWGTHGR